MKTKELYSHAKVQNTFFTTLNGLPNGNSKIRIKEISFLCFTCLVVVTRYFNREDTNDPSFMLIVNSFNNYVLTNILMHFADALG